MKTYQAILFKDRLKWKNKPPHADQPVEVNVTFSPKQVPRSNGIAMAKALQELAELGTFSEIKDPVAWQREIRKDRPLPGRE